MSRTDRRRFVTGAAAIAGGAVLAPFASCTDGSEPAASPGDPSADPAAAGPSTSATASSSAASTTTSAVAIDPDEPTTWRDQFALTPDVAHFAAWTLASHPRQVADAIATHRRGLDEDTAGYQLANQFELEDRVRNAAARYLDAEPRHIALTDSTTMGLGVVYGGMRLDEGDEVVTTAHDFFATYEALRLRALATGARIRTVRLYDDPAKASVDEIVGHLIDAVTPRTRAMALTWVHSGTGVKLPIAEIAGALAGANERRTDRERVLLCVDAVHALGVEEDTPAELGCDVLVSGTHKWLFGPRGTGIVWIRGRALARIAPVIPPFEASSFGAWFNRQPPLPATDASRLTPGGYHSFEHRWALAEAFAFHRRIGKRNVRAATHDQATRLKDGIAELAGVRLVTPTSTELSSGIVCVDVGDLDPAGVFDALRRRGSIAGVTPYRTTYLRMGPSIVTTPDEVDALLDQLADVI